jgi:hypothetical protein
VAPARICALIAGQFATVWSWNVAGSVTGPPSSRTTPKSRFGRCLPGGSVPNHLTAG